MNIQWDLKMEEGSEYKIDPTQTIDPMEEGWPETETLYLVVEGPREGIVFAYGRYYSEKF